MTTLKVRYNIEEENKSKILNYIKNYNSVFNCLFNHFQDLGKVLSTKEIFEFINKLNNIFIDTYFKNGALIDAKQVFEIFKDQKIIFGSKKLFLARIKNLISREEFQIKKLRPLQIVGASHNKGNCKFQIISDNKILFKASRKDHFILNLQNIGKNYKKYLNALILCQKSREIPITYKLDTEFVYITFDDKYVISKIKDLKISKKLENRVFSIDINPNSIGWTVVDWKSETEYTVVASGLISIKDLNDYENSLSVASDSKEKKYITNKRKHEIIQIGYELTKIANHYRCEVFGIEDLNIKSSDKCKGRKFNKLVNNQWNRNLLLRIIEKNCKYFEIHFQKVMANFSSFQGNLVYRSEKLPDPCLSSIEIGRRSYEFYHQYIIKDKEKTKNIVFDKLENVKSRVIQSLEELNCSVAFENLSDLYYTLKKRKCKYRFSLEEALKNHIQSFSSTKHSKSYVKFYNFA